MFDKSMSFETMDRIIFESKMQQNKTIEEIVKELEARDLELYLNAYKAQYKIEEPNFADVSKVGYDVFVIASEKQLRQ